ncbi:NUDIX domain-containing protein [Lacticaseibacillus brantae]|uniref:NUDIX domain-containing protein n=1 Tax=Lacticaseibacillus brantae TaxID=943673 RepID=UPI000708BE7C
MAQAYTLILVETPAGILLINRKKPPYRGLWNALGGKIEPDETPKAGAQRELVEESGLTLTAAKLQANGVVHWYVDGQFRADLYLFSGTTTQTGAWPLMTREGLLAAVDREWLTAPDNLGIVADLKALLPRWLAGEQHAYRSDFTGTKFESLVIADD